MNDVILFVVSIAVFLYSVILHEIAHGWVAYQYGDDTAKISGRLSLNPIVHIDPIGSIMLPILLYFSTGFTFGYAKPVPVNPVQLRGGSKAYRMVSLAGILTNLLIATVAGLLFRFATRNFGLDGTNLGVIACQIIFQLNMVLAVFNAIPLPGFDGYNFIGTFGPVRDFIARTPLGNPYFMATWGMVISFGLLLLFHSAISGVLGFVIDLYVKLLGIG